MIQNHEFEWATKSIDPICKHLLLGSFTSDGGKDYYYYASSRNHFWYLLDSVLTCPKENFDGKSCGEIKKTILAKDGFAKLINELKKTSSPKESDKIIKDIHKRLIEKSFDICDLFRMVQVHDSKLNNDANIIIDKSKMNDLVKMLKNSNVTNIYCTSNYVADLLKKAFPQLGIKTSILTAPTTNNRISLEAKINNWRKTI